MIDSPWRRLSSAITPQNVMSEALLHIEPVAPHFLGRDAGDGDVLSLVIDIDAHAPLAAVALVLVALALERAPDHRDVRHARNGEDRIFLLVVGDRLQRRAVGEPQRHVVLEREARLARGIDHVDPVRHEHGAAGAGYLIDRRLNRGGIVGLAVALGALILHADHER